MRTLQRSGRTRRAVGAVSAPTTTSAPTSSASQVAWRGPARRPGCSSTEPSPCAGSAGNGAVHCSCANWQRLANRQPVGHEPGGGTVPAIDASRSGTGSPSGTCGLAPSRAIVYGCAGVVQDGGGGAGLDDLAGVHHRDVVADVGDHAEVVADDDHRQAGVADQRPQQAEDLGLHGDVEGGGRLVGDQQLRLAGQRQRDADPLRHAAGQLVRVALQHPLRRRRCRPAAAARRRSSWPRARPTPRNRRIGWVSW